MNTMRADYPLSKDDDTVSEQSESPTWEELEALRPFITAKRWGNGSHVSNEEIVRMVEKEAHHTTYPAQWETLPPAVFMRLRTRFDFVKGARRETAYA